MTANKPMDIRIDAAELTLGDMEFFEDQSGLTFEQLGEGKTNTKALLALVVIHKRHHGSPEFTMDDARAVRVGEITVGTPDEDNEDAAASPPKGKAGE